MSAQTFHIIGDVHGCRRQLETLLTRLGYQPADFDPELWVPPPGAQAIFVGDLVDRGPDSLGCLRMCRKMIQAGHARMVVGNHEFRAKHILTYLLGRTKTAVPMTLDGYSTWVQLMSLQNRDMLSLRLFLDKAPPFLELVPGELIVAHARWEERFRELDHKAQMQACATGESDEPDRISPDDINYKLAGKRSARGMVDLDPFDALSKRARWVRRWHGPAWVVWGHQVVRPGQVVRIGRTICLDSGCCNGFALSAFVWPTHEIVQVDGDEPWRERMAKYEPEHDLILPLELNDVRTRDKDSGVTDADAYVAHIDGQLAEKGLPPMWRALAEAHRGLFGRVHRAPRRPMYPRR